QPGRAKSASMSSTRPRCWSRLRAAPRRSCDRSTTQPCAPGYSSSSAAERTPCSQPTSRKRSRRPLRAAFTSRSIMSTCSIARGLLGDVDGLVAADRFEIEEQQQIDHRHRRGNERVSDERAAVADDVRLVHGFLFRVSLVHLDRFLHIAKLLAIEPEYFAEDE